MNKKRLLLVFFAALWLPAIAASSSIAQAPEEPAGAETSSTRSIPIDAVPKQQGVESDTKGAGDNAARPLSPAPALTSIFVNNVCTSAQENIGDCETIASGQLSTKTTYTGSDVYTFVWEIGYGTGEIASQGGIQLSKDKLKSTKGICKNGNEYTIDCLPGNTIVGWRYVWDVGYWLSRGSGQNFTAQDTSQNPPIRTYSTSLTIKYRK